MGNIIIADIEMTVSDETYYVMQSRMYEERYKRETLEETESNLIKHGWRKSSWIDRADGVKVDWWNNNGVMIAVWDNDILPYRYLR